MVNDNLAMNGPGDGDKSKGRDQTRNPHKRPRNHQQHSHPKPSRQAKKQKLVDTSWPQCSNEDVLHAEVRDLIKQNIRSDSEADPERPSLFDEREVTITTLSSTGDGLAFDPATRQVFVIPFCIPGDSVKIRPYRHVEQPPHYIADFLSVVIPSPQRDDSLINCKYFAACGGCQFQQLPYDQQLVHKRGIVEKAYARFSGLNAAQTPTVRETMPSPLQYGYRTK